MIVWEIASPRDSGPWSSPPSQCCSRWSCSSCGQPLHNNAAGAVVTWAVASKGCGKSLGRDSCLQRLGPGRPAMEQERATTRESNWKAGGNSSPRLRRRRNLSSVVNNRNRNASSTGNRWRTLLLPLEPIRQNEAFHLPPRADTAAGCLCVARTASFCMTSSSYAETRRASSASVVSCLARAVPAATATSSSV